MTGTQGRLGLRVPEHRVHPRAMAWWGLRGLLRVAVARLVLRVLERELPQYSAEYWDPLVLVTYVVGVVLVIIVPPVRYQIQRWEVGDESVFARDGLLRVCLRVAPFARIQAVASRRGPLEMMLRLSTVIVTTASSMGPVYLVGLDRDRAAEIETELSIRAERSRGEGT